MLCTIFLFATLMPMRMPTPKELKEQFPIDQETAQFITGSRDTVKEIIERRENRLLLIVGPCSIHNMDEGLEYASKLKELQNEVKDSCFLVMRSYIEKSRTGDAWKGLVHDPYLNESNDIEAGLKLSRLLLIKLAEMRVPTATEFLSPLVTPYIEDLITWGSIGARTSTSQIHRLLASHLPMPIGFKNSLDGNIDTAIQGVNVARHPHQFLHVDDEGTISSVKSLGNPNSHIVLRGSLSGPNYDTESVQAALNKLRTSELPPRLLIDCSHGNSEKKYFKQKECFHDVLKQINEGNQHIFGMMLESHLEAGTQVIPNQLNELQDGVSVTDSCIDIEETKELVYSISGSMSLTHS